MSRRHKHRGFEPARQRAGSVQVVCTDRRRHPRRLITNLAVFAQDDTRFIVDLGIERRDDYSEFSRLYERGRNPTFTFLCTQMRLPGSTVQWDCHRDVQVHERNLIRVLALVAKLAQHAEPEHVIWDISNEEILRYSFQQ